MMRTTITEIRKSMRKRSRPKPQDSILAYQQQLHHLDVVICAGTVQRCLTIYSLYAIRGRHLNQKKGIHAHLALKTRQATGQDCKGERTTTQRRREIDLLCPPDESHWRLSVAVTSPRQRVLDQPQ